MEDLKKETIHLEDGRKAERLIQEAADPNTGEATTTIEVWAEPKIEKKLTQRVIESRRPVVYRREIEHVDETGQVVEKKVETIDPDVKMELREHIRTNDSVSAMNVKEDNCYATQEDIKNMISEGLTTIVKMLHPESEEPVGNVSMQSIIEEKIETDSNNTAKMLGYAGWTLIAVLTGVFLYFVLFL